MKTEKVILSKINHRKNGDALHSEKKRMPLSEGIAIESRNPVKLIVGLGNPGEGYGGNRHNIGFMVIDRLLNSGNVTVRKDCQSDLSELELGSRKIFLQKPLTYMNSSGDAVRELCHREKISPAEMLIVYDDLDLKPGRLRFRLGGSSGGHNGIKSISECVGTDGFGRLKLGIGKPDPASAVLDYVLGDFAERELSLLNKVVDTATQAIRMLCGEGYKATMNHFNGKTVEC